MKPLLAVLACVACANQPAPQPIAPSDPTTAPAPPGPGEWGRWSYAQKLAYMKYTMLPAERALFSELEPVRYATLNCHSCHGAGAESGTFTMPNPELPRLAPAKEGFVELSQHEPEMLKFMQQRVVPETAKLLGLPPFQMESHIGFSCWQCHLKTVETNY